MWKKIFTFLLVCAATIGSATARDISFQLRDTQGSVTEKSYPGKYLLLAIGYTSCPDICPTTLYEYALVMKELKNPDAIQPIFVTIDPVNDEVNRLNEYTRYFDERIVGLTGEMKNIQALANQLGATFGYRQDGKKIENPVLGDVYSVYHSALIYLISPDGKLLDVFDYQMGAKNLTQALDKILPSPSKTNTSMAPAARSHWVKATAAHACVLPQGFSPSENALPLKSLLPADAPAQNSSRPVLLNVWALWCAPCRKELPLLEQLAQSSHTDLVVQTLNLGDKPSEVQKLFTQMQLKALPQTISENRGLLSEMNARGLPLTAIFVQGKEVARKSGLITQTEDIAAYARCLQPGA